jgi:hypothetical protein
MDFSQTGQGDNSNYTDYLLYIGQPVILPPIGGHQASATPATKKPQYSGSYLGQLGCEAGLIAAHSVTLLGSALAPVYLIKTGVYRRFWPYATAAGSVVMITTAVQDRKTCVGAVYGPNAK